MREGLAESRRIRAGADGEIQRDRGRRRWWNGKHGNSGLVSSKELRQIIRRIARRSDIGYANLVAANTEDVPDLAGWNLRPRNGEVRQAVVERHRWRVRVAVNYQVHHTRARPVLSAYGHHYRKPLLIGDR